MGFVSLMRFKTDMTCIGGVQHGRVPRRVGGSLRRLTVHKDLAVLVGERISLRTVQHGHAAVPGVAFDESWAPVAEMADEPVGQPSETPA